MQRALNEEPDMIRNMTARPRLLITLGDVAGIGPEIAVKAWPELQAICMPTIVGDVGTVRRAAQVYAPDLGVFLVGRVGEMAPTERVVPVLQATTQNLASIEMACVSAVAGRAAYDFLCTAIELTQAGHADAIVTLPLHKEGLHAAGLKYPGHTEILADRTGVRDFGMMLYAPPGPSVVNGIGVVHVTLHMALRDVFRHITTQAVRDKIQLLHGVMQKLCDREPRLVVAALNPHASDGGLFGDEERTILLPAVESARQSGIRVKGPLPSDTLFVHAQRGEYDGVVAMYHDQGHIALKLLTGLAAVNVTLGLPIVRTSVAHGTAYDIAGKGIGDPRSLLEAARVAATLVNRR